MNVNIYVELQKIQLYILSQSKLNLFFGMNILKKKKKSLKPTYLGTPSSLFEDDSIKIK